MDIAGRHQRKLVSRVSLAVGVDSNELCSCVRLQLILDMLTFSQHEHSRQESGDFDLRRRSANVQEGDLGRYRA